MKRSILLPAMRVALVATFGSATAYAQHLSFMTCPIVRDTKTVPCWLAEYNGEAGDWKSFADGYRITLVDETRRSHTAEFLREPGARVVYRDDEITIVLRPAS